MESSCYALEQDHGRHVVTQQNVACVNWSHYKVEYAFHLYELRWRKRKKQVGYLSPQYLVFTIL